jgi:hypothetical protein
MKDVNLAIFAFYVSAAYPLIRRPLLLIAVVAFQLGNILSRKNGSDTVNASNKKYIRKG